MELGEFLEIDMKEFLNGLQSYDIDKKIKSEIAEVDDLHGLLSPSKSKEVSINKSSQSNLQPSIQQVQPPTPISNDEYISKQIEESLKDVGAITINNIIASDSLMKKLNEKIEQTNHQSKQTTQIQQNAINQSSSNQVQRLPPSNIPLPPNIPLHTKNVEQPHSLNQIKKEEVQKNKPITPSEKKDALTSSLVDNKGNKSKELREVLTLENQLSKLETKLEHQDLTDARNIFDELDNKINNISYFPNEKTLLLFRLEESRKKLHFLKTKKESIFADPKSEKKNKVLQENKTEKQKEKNEEAKKEKKQTEKKEKINTEKKQTEEKLIETKKEIPSNNFSSNKKITEPKIEQKSTPKTSESISKESVSRLETSEKQDDVDGSLFHQEKNSFSNSTSNEPLTSVLMSNEYKQALFAIEQKNKQKALELLLPLAKQHPNNIGIRVRIKEALSL